MRDPSPHGGNGDGLLDRSRRVRDDAARLGQSLGDLLEGGEDRLRGELERRPYLTLTIAAGAGYVLGGGLPPRIVRWTLAVGGRLFVASILRDLVSTEAERRSA